MKRLDAIVMAGGRGTRLGLKEKPLVKLCGKPVIGYVLEALSESEFIDKIVVTTSKHTKKTEEFLKIKSIKTLETSGAGYVEDMINAVENLGFGKTLVVSSDLPLISTKEIDAVIEVYFRQSRPAMKVVVPVELFQKLGMEPSLAEDGFVPSGINIVDGKNINGEEYTLVTENGVFAFNLNTQKDLEIIERYKKLINY